MLPKMSPKISSKTATFTTSKGQNLRKDLKRVMNNQKYSDIEIVCKDENTLLYACGAILAARSEVFDRVLYGEKREAYTPVSFPNLHSSGMKIILEYTYTGSIKEVSLTKDNIIEAFCAADTFQLQTLQSCIISTFEKNYIDNSPELLSKVVKTMPLSEDNNLRTRLVEVVTMIPLNTIEFGRLSIEALQYLLEYVYKEKNLLETAEYEVFRCAAILAAKKVSNNAYTTLTERLPPLENIDQAMQLGNEPIPDHQKVAEELDPLIKLIDFSLIEGHILVDTIEPLAIVPIILNIYRDIIKASNLTIHEIPFVYIWEESTCGSKLVLEDNGKVVYASNDCNSFQSAKCKMGMDKGIFEWDFIIEKRCPNAWVGLFANEWALGVCLDQQSPSFRDGTKVSNYLDVDRREYTISIDGELLLPAGPIKDFPSEVYLATSIMYPGRIRIQTHQK